ncbi:hypothetical protein AB0I81_24875 [Nonomuraea sp. NPDC050404]|uniref:tetratricopeptide repeat protein n=1 Tax=Nonomuraea sp. NPDC050404 TaxID=3155783 RepID=UPI0033D7D46B
MDSRVQNEALHALIRQAAWNGQGLAEAVNAVGREANFPLAYTRSSAGQWLAGMVPRRPVPHIVAEALSRRLGRQVTTAEAGFGESAQEDGDGTSDRLIALAVAGSPANLATSPYRVYRLSGFPGDEEPRVPAPEPSPNMSAPAGSVRVGRKDVESAEEMLRLFTGADAAGGAGHVRTALGLYLANAIAPSLAAATREIRAELMSVAARLAYLCGVMCRDDELHGFAQQYYLIALRLAARAGESGVRARVLTSMSVQAVALGHHDRALALARASVATAAGELPPEECARLLGQRAVAHAAAGDRQGALADMAAAQAGLKRAGDPSRTAAAALAYRRGVMLALLGDTPKAITQLEISVRHSPATERHSRAITLSHIAGLQLRHGYLKEAIATWHRFLDDYPAINSGRARTALAHLQSGVRPYHGVPSARALLTRAVSLQQRLPQLTTGPRAASAIAGL